LRNLLLEKHLLVETTSGNYVLTRDPSHLRLADIASLSGRGSAGLPGTKAKEALIKYPWFAQLSDILNRANKQLEDTLSPTVAELFASESTANEKTNDQNY